MHRMFHLADSITVEVHGQAPRVVATPYLGNGYTHEAIAAGECLRNGLVEHPLMRHEETLALMEVLDEIRGQIGLRYPADEV